MKVTKTKDLETKDNYDEIMPVVPDWKNRIFFFDFEEKFDAYIELIIMDWKGEKFTLDKILLKNKVDDIKTSIFKLKGIKKKKQIIKFDGKILHKSRTLREQNVVNRSILVLELSGGNTIVTPSVERLHGIFTTLPTRLVTDINIVVNHWNGDSFTLSAAPNDYIDDVKDSIYDLKKIPFNDLRLSFQGQPTNDDLNLKEQGIVDGAILVLEPMKIFLQLPMTEELVCVDVEMNDKIRSIKKIAAKKTRLPSKSLCIMYGGDELGNAKTLRDYGIEHEDEILVETFEITIMHWNGKMFSVNGLSPNCTTYDLKIKISKLQSIPVEQQKLNMKGQVLNDVLTLAHQGIHHKAILLLDDPVDRVFSPLRQKLSFKKYLQDHQKCRNSYCNDGSEKGVQMYLFDDNTSIRSTSTSTSTTRSSSTKSSPKDNATMEKHKLSKHKRKKKKKKSKSSKTKKCKPEKSMNNGKWGKKKEKRNDCTSYW